MKTYIKDLEAYEPEDLKILQEVFERLAAQLHVERDEDRQELAARILQCAVVPVTNAETLLRQVQWP